MGLDQFEADGRGIVFTRGDSASRTDIVRYDLATAKVAPVKETAESEYSATPMPDGRGYSVIRVELDGIQRLWRLDPGRGKADDLLVATTRPIGCEYIDGGSVSSIDTTCPTAALAVAFFGTMMSWP